MAVMDSPVKSPSDRTLEEFELALVKDIAERQLILDGLDGNQAYERVIESFKRTACDIDARWHTVNDPNILIEMRITKMAAVELINYLDYVRSDLERLRMELAKIKNPDDIINKYNDDN